MTLSRREFAGAGAAGLAGAYLAASGLDALAARGARGGGNAAPHPEIEGEDGSKLWLRHAPLTAPGIPNANRGAATTFEVRGNSPTCDAIRDELKLALSSLYGQPAPPQPPLPGLHGVVVGTVQAGLDASDVAAELKTVGQEGYVIRNIVGTDVNAIAISANTDLGCLYGTFHFLRLLQTGKPIDRNLKIVEKPKLVLRMLNHWDNFGGDIERGYGGRSNWLWNQLPGTLSPRYKEIARANAAIGINGATINNVNANAVMLLPENLEKMASLANVWRPYGVRMFLSIRFSAPTDRTFANAAVKTINTADPLDPTVAAWWKAKCDEIYKVIPDFGGFLVKANSEGQPGPKDYGRTHAEGANVLADALAPHNGYVIWRAFVYDESVDPDRVKRAYIEFTRLDGKFKPNVLIQVKNGPLDFQPREPYHPLFGGMKQSPCLAELQPTQEYLGQAKHLVYLGTMWEEFLKFDTGAKGPGSTVGKALDGSIFPYSVTGMVGVTNPGNDPNWCGHHFSQANWYALGRLAWNHELTAKEIAEEWTRMTFTNDDATVGTIVDMMMSSRETYLNYTMPLGLHHMIGGDHYAPQPQNSGGGRPDWTAVYYHKASAEGIGYDRTNTTGDKYVDQYYPPVRDLFNSLDTCPDKFLLWFHRCAWNYKMKSGQTFWQELVDHYYHGTAAAAAMQATWQGLAAKIDARRHREVADRLAIQVTDSARWRDQILQYFGGFSRMEITPPKT